MASFNSQAISMRFPKFSNQWQCISCRQVNNMRSNAIKLNNPYKFCNYKIQKSQFMFQYLLFIFFSQTSYHFDGIHLKRSWSCLQICFEFMNITIQFNNFISIFINCTILVISIAFLCMKL